MVPGDGGAASAQRAPVPSHTHQASMSEKRTTGASDRDVVRNAKARPSHRTFYLALAALVILGIVVVGYAWQRGKGAGAATAVSNDAAVTLSGGYVRGSPDAAIEIVEFGDFECPGCGDFARQTEPQIQTNLVAPGIARFRFIDLQVTPTHRNAPAASVAAGCANDQGKFWEMHDRIFAGQAEWSTTATLQPKPILQGYAREIGLDVKAWDECYTAERHIETLTTNMQQAVRVGLSRTPSIMIGRRVLIGAQPYERVKAAVDSALAEAKREKPSGN